MALRLDIPVTRAGHTILKADRETSRWEIWESWAQGQSLKPGVRESQGRREEGFGAKEMVRNRGDPEGTVPGSQGRTWH